MGTSTLSFRVDDEKISAIEHVAEENHVSRSQLARTALLRGLEAMRDGDTGDIEVPEHLAHDAKIHRIIQENKATRRKGKFRKEFIAQLKRSFENGEHPAEFEQSVAGYIEEAEDMGDLPEPVADETGCDTFEEWVQDKLEYYAAAYQASTFDAEPIENPLGNHAGVVDAGKWLDRAEAIAEAANDPRKDETKMARFALKDGIAPEEADTPAETVREALATVDMTQSLPEESQ